MTSEQQRSVHRSVQQEPELQPMTRAAPGAGQRPSGGDTALVRQGGLGQPRIGRGQLLLGGGAVLLLVAAVVSLGLLDPKPGPDNGKLAQPGFSMIRAVAPAEQEKAIALLMMGEADKSKVRAELANGKLRIGLITVSDNQAEDGDWVRVVGAGFRQDVRLLHKAYTLAVPYLPGMPVSIQGLVDGGGGDITIAVYVGSARLTLKPMKKGENISIPTP